MRIIAVMLAALLLFGCAGPEESANETNASIGNVTANDTNATTGSDTTTVQPSNYKRYDAKGFSFEHPKNMDVQEAKGIFTGTHNLDGQTGEILVVTYLNTSLVYGPNQDRIYQGDPTEAVTTFIRQDRRNDSAQMLSLAHELGDATTYSIARDVAVAEQSFRVRFSQNGNEYYGYALDMYVPERSMQIKARIVALSSTKAEDMKDRFLLSFRLE